MKKIMMSAISLILCAMFFTGCTAFLPNEPTTDENFAYGYSISKSEAKQGELVTVTATVTNISGKDYTYTGASSDCRPEVRLHSFKPDGEIDKVINHEPAPSTDDVGEHVLKDGEILSYTYSFKIPDDAFCADYGIYISCFGYGREIKDVLKVVEKNDGQTTSEPDDVPDEPAKDSGMFSEGRLYFHVFKSEALLVDSKGSLTWIYSETEDFFEGFDSGDYVKIEHGFVMESYPGQTYASAIELIENGNIYSFTDEEWERLSEVFADPPERSGDISEYLVEDNGKHYLILPISGTRLHIWDDYVSYLENIDIGLLTAAEEVINNKTSAYAESPGLFVEEYGSGELYLCAEWIVDIDPPNIETTENGEVIENGCGIDHDHIFYKERITK